MALPPEIQFDSILPKSIKRKYGRKMAFFKRIWKFLRRSAKGSGAGRTLKTDRKGRFYCEIFPKKFVAEREKRAKKGTQWRRNDSAKKKREIVEKSLLFENLNGGGEKSGKTRAHDDFFGEKERALRKKVLQMFENVDRTYVRC